MKTPSPGFQSPSDKTPTSQAHLSRVASPDTAQLSSLPPNWPAVDKKNDTSRAIENGLTQSRSPSARCAKLSRSGSPKQPVKETKARRTPSAPLRVPIEPGHCLVFGRKPDTSAISSEVTPKSTLLPIILPKSFNHASRTHCLCTLIAPPLGGLNIRIVVKGQNGLMVDGERFEAGSSAGVELERRDGEQIELGFYGGKKVECYVRLDENSSNRARGRVGGQNTAENGVPERPSISATSRGSKRRRTNTLTRGGASCEAPPGEYSKPSGHAISPQSAVSDHISPNTLSSACESTVFCLSVGDRVRALIPSLGIDLVGFIASAIVFSPRATVSTTQVIRAVLEAQPSLAEAVLAIMPTPTPQQNMNKVDSNAELKAYAVAGRLSSAGPNESFQIKTERECCSAPLPSDYPSTEDIDLKPTVPEFKDYPSFGSPSCRSYFEGLPVEDKIDRVVDACRPVILETLNKGWKADGTGMFGCVTNDGLKDASGEPLDSLWYYQPQRDQDLERRGNLQPYVRHIRHTQTTSKQYYFKKVRGSGRRKS
ncbi:hypothetical protein BY996DRAFT_4576210 [Phakopsora pachyrhizi]|nr:hypothetical protein BY996DRAFT_4605556 [Phakopsora pachyrhizi]KAI8459259.1 hypothetical protein BY996DRAFT_4576210 [Phakopsora pachyrhizi]